MALTYESELDQLQAERVGWAKRNFPNAGVKEHVLGVCEEAGELAHAVLKMSPGLKGGGTIRGDKDKLMTEAADAVGDIVVYLAGVCTDLGLSLHDCVGEAWEQVKERDWNKNKEDGSTLSPNHPAMGNLTQEEFDESGYDGPMVK